MKKMHSIMRNRKGETLVEVLVAIVVSGLAILMLGMAIASAASTNVKSRDAFKSYYDGNNAIAELALSTPPDGTATLVTSDTNTEVAITDDSDKNGIPITYKSNTENGIAVVAYTSNDGS